MNDRRRHSARNQSHASRMETGRKTEPQRAAPRLYLVTAPVADAAAVAGSLADALKTADVAAVLVRLAEGDERTQINRVKALAAIVQDAGAALLLDDHAAIVARAGADGAHLAGIEAFQAALGTLKPQWIAGGGGFETRHDAMLAAESGADYVMFGEPDAAGQRPSFEAVLDRVEWWAEVFEIPCVAYAADLDEVGALATAIPEFVAVSETIWRDAAALAEAVRRLAVAEPVP
jgi:thiamine-phosphate pyrophosphorylase